MPLGFIGFIRRFFACAARVTGNHPDHTGKFFHIGRDAPETSAGKRRHGCLLRFVFGLHLFSLSGLRRQGDAQTQQPQSCFAEPLTFHFFSPRGPKAVVFKSNDDPLDVKSAEYLIDIAVKSTYISATKKSDDPICQSSVNPLT